MRRPHCWFRAPLIGLLSTILSAPAFAGSLDLPTVELSTTSIAFGNQVVDSRSQSKTVLLLNRGSKALTITGISASGDFAAANDCGGKLEPGHGCTILTTFSPSLVGNADGKVSIVDDSKSSPHVITLSGTGVLPLSITPATLQFEPRTVGTSQTASVTVTNNRPEEIQLQISSTVDLTPIIMCHGVIPAGKNCLVRITFTPTQAQQMRGKITFSYGAGVQVLMVNGAGVSRAPQVSGLRVHVPRVPEVRALAPAIPPTPVVSAALPIENRTAVQVAQTRDVISPAPSVSGVLPASSTRQTENGTPAVVPPPPRTVGQLGATRTGPLVTGTPGVIAPPPNLSSRTGGELKSPAGPLVNGTPTVIAPPPGTNTLLIAAKNAPSTTAVAPPPPATQTATMARVSDPQPAGPTESKMVASAKAPADTRAVSQTPVSDTQASAAAVPVPALNPPAVAHERANELGPAMMRASIPPANTRPASTGGVRVTLTVGLKGTAAGTVTSSIGAINCGAACQGQFAAGQKVVLAPQTVPNSSFAGWRGCDSVNGTNCTVVMDRDKSVTAIFVKHYDDLSPE